MSRFARMSGYDLDLTLGVQSSEKTVPVFLSKETKRRENAKKYYVKFVNSQYKGTAVFFLINLMVKNDLSKQTWAILYKYH